MQIPDEILIYITQYVNRDLSKQGLEKLNSWIRESGENKTIFYKYLSCERKFSAFSKWDSIDKLSDWGKVEHRLKRRKHRNLYLYLGTVAASLIIFFSLGILLRLNRDIDANQQIVEFKDISTPGKPSAILTLSSGEKIQLGESENKIIKEKNSTNINIDSTNSIKYDSKETQTEELVYNTVIVPKSGEYSLVLSDGSKVWLNSETTIKYPVKFIGKTREVFLSGEAYFDVQKDASRPFIVHNKRADVKVLGTSFNVMSYEDEEKAEITLVSGKVEVLKGKEAKRIMPGEQAKIGNEIEGIKVNKVDTRYYTSWREGVFYFDNANLYDLTRKLSRWYNVEFFFEDNSLKELRFSGAVTKYRSIDYLLDLIEKTNNVDFRIKGDAIWISHRK